MGADANGVTGDTLNSDLGKQDDTLHCTTARSPLEHRVVRLDAYVPLKHVAARICGKTWPHRTQECRTRCNNGALGGVLSSWGAGISPKRIQFHKYTLTQSSIQTDISVATETTL